MLGSKVAAMGPGVRSGFQDEWGRGSHPRYVLAGGGRIQMMLLRGRNSGSCPLGDVRLVAQRSMVAPYLVM